MHSSEGCVCVCVCVCRNHDTCTCVGEWRVLERVCMYYVCVYHFDLACMCVCMCVRVCVGVGVGGENSKASTCTDKALNLLITDSTPQLCMVLLCGQWMVITKSSLKYSLPHPQVDGRAGPFPGF